MGMSAAGEITITCWVLIEGEELVTDRDRCSRLIILLKEYIIAAYDSEIGQFICRSASWFFEGKIRRATATDVT